MTTKRRKPKTRHWTTAIFPKAKKASSRQTKSSPPPPRPQPLDHPAPPWWPTEPERRDLNKPVPGERRGRVIVPDPDIDPEMEINPDPRTPEDREKERRRRWPRNGLI